MSNDKTAKDFELDDLEKPLTEQEMKEAAGGEGERTPIVQVINGQLVIVGYIDPRATGQFGYMPPQGIKPPPAQGAPGTLTNPNMNAPQPGGIVTPVTPTRPF
ncbi:hypothetical protein [Paenibacillus contaminans]|uniref:Uncharacterized protein n=1 Tax=Paenibacillus contaminans TaxID=450362 RepID=A0A329MU56_9BACL|nr:hypothetical protein [Paenibacillus contaminans]RAV21487.1 hypothetical protein DQG23_09425 [Paenibacillus contaminans]